MHIDDEDIITDNCTTLKKKDNRYKNSYHLYVPKALFKSNAHEMKAFVFNMFASISSDPDMYALENG